MSGARLWWGLFASLCLGLFLMASGRTLGAAGPIQADYHVEVSLVYPNQPALYQVELGDVDADGVGELVLVDTGDDFLGPKIYVYDAATLVLKSSRALADYMPWLELGQLDADPALEIVVAGFVTTEVVFPILSVYDGATLAQEATLEYPAERWIAPYDLLVEEVDGDGRDEILLVEKFNLRIYETLDAPPSVTLPFSSTDHRRAALGELDGDAGLELALVDDAGLQVYAAESWTLEYQAGLSYGHDVVDVAILPAGPGEAGELLIATFPSPIYGRLRALTGGSYVPGWSVVLPAWVRPFELLVEDLDQDGAAEFVLSAADWSDPALSYLLVGSRLGTAWLAEYTNRDLAASPFWWAPISAGQVDDDAGLELIFGGDAEAYLLQPELHSMNPSQLGLPVLAK